MGQDSNFMTQGAKLCRIPSGLQWSCFVQHKIDWFLAVLNINGGSFSPHPQKLPFAVTNVDGDNYPL
ncbi:hypothetical protein CTI12_AA108210 [Artemisia annua]|uniref:Uncharacterized protein n=1 Tax=Artemisia annua TaxID=35608 RepID=A0A2U1PN33_ARTAN|nr:hypothetical protein CTI12_AA108210 [Artemisia annua]